MNPTVPYWFALFLGGGTLVFYLLSAFWNRSKIEPISEAGAEEDFNLGLPDSSLTQNPRSCNIGGNRPWTAEMHLR